METQLKNTIFSDGINVLSLFDGMACGMLAMQKAGFKVNNYYAYEIDKYAIKTVLYNFPNIQESGDVLDEDFSKYKDIDFLIGGSPCTYWSIAQSPDKRETTASGLGWKLFSQYVRAIKEAKPKYFIYENNKSMAKNIYKSISESFGFEPIMINSALVSAQNRQRYYWVGKRSKDGTYSKVNIEQPEDKGILLKDVLDGVVDRKKSRAIIASIGRTTTREYFGKNQGQMSCEPVAFSMVGDLTNRRVGTKDKAYCLAANPSSDMSARVIEPVACRCRGRKDENGNGCAKYECRNDYKSNTLDTNSTNGNMIAEPVDKPIRVGVYPTSDGRMLNSQGMRIYSIDGKSVTQSAQGGGMGAKTGLYAIPVEFDRGIPIKAISCSDGKTYKVNEVKNGLITIKEKQYPIKLQDGHYIIRKLTVSECKRLQTVPEWYEFPVSDTQAYKMLGNGWTVDVIAHIFSFL